MPSHPQTRTPCPPPRSPPYSPPPRRASPRAAPPGRLPARRAARSAPRRPTPSTRASRCSSTATGSSSRPVRDGRLSSLVSTRARRGHARRPPRSIADALSAPRAIARDDAPALASLCRGGRARPIRPITRLTHALARTHSRTTERFAHVPKSEKNTPFCSFFCFRRSPTNDTRPQRSSTAARTTLRSSTSA